MYTHLLALTYRDDDWLVSTNGSERAPIGRIVESYAPAPEEPNRFDARAFVPEDGPSVYVGTFPDLLSAANAVYGVHLAVTA
jgi:hypothetical protein